MSHIRKNIPSRWMALLVLALIGLVTIGCTADESSRQSRDEATAEGREAYKAGDYATAYEELYPIAKAGDPLSEFFIARMYHFGEGREQDIDEAIMWYRRSAEAGAAPAQYNLGRIYHVETEHKNTNRAIEWYKKAAENGNANAMHSLGYVYAELDDPETAFKWRKRGADAGSRQAQFDVALSFENGDGVRADPTKALQYYQQSARQSYAPAMANLAVLYDEGTGVKRDLKKVYQWFSLAAEQNWKGAEEEVEKLELALTADELSEAGAMAIEWRREHLAK